MKDKFKDAFCQIHAEESLKESTRNFLYQKTGGYAKAVRRPYRAVAAACACLLIFFAAGSRLYFTPTTEISIDINPSVELGVNRFERVISVIDRSNDGSAPAQAFDVKFMNYADAIDQILDNEAICALLSDNEVMAITVTGPDQAQSSNILSKIESRTARQRNTYCYFASSKEAKAAREAGLSYGKYKAFLELKALDPDAAPDSIRCMTMREIRDLCDCLLKETEKEGAADSETRIKDGQGRRSCNYGGRRRQKNSK